MIGRVILSIGHGAGDPGAVSGNIVENTECRQICEILDRALGVAGINRVFLPDLSYVDSIKKVNQIYQPGDWAIEIHKDSFPKYNADMMHRRMGVYYHRDSITGMNVAKTMVAAYVNDGAHKTTWTRPDSFSGHGGLGWNTMTKPMAHIIECGFVQGQNGPEEDYFYANAILHGIQAVINKF